MRFTHIVVSGALIAFAYAHAVAAERSQCLDYAGHNVVLDGYWAMHGKPSDTSAVQTNCLEQIATHIDEARALVELGRAQIANGLFVDADRSLANSLLGESGEAWRLRGVLRDIGLLGVPRDTKAAQQFYERAIRFGDTDALVGRSRGIVEDAEDAHDPVPERAVDLLQVAVGRKYPPAMDDLAALIEHGDVSTMSARDAVKLLEDASSAGWLPAKFRLATFYARGFGVERDPIKAASLGREVLTIIPAPFSLPAGFGQPYKNLESSTP